MTGTNELVQNAFKMFLWCPSVEVVSREIAKQGDLGQMMVLNPEDVPCPVYM